MWVPLSDKNVLVGGVKFFIVLQEKKLAKLFSHYFEGAAFPPLLTCFFTLHRAPHNEKEEVMHLWGNLRNLVY